MQLDTNARTNSTPKNRGWLSRFRPWLVALFMPFLIAGLWGSYYGYHYQWKDIYVRHPGAFQYMTEADAERSCWESALQLAIVFGVPAGVLGLGGYGCFVLCRRLLGQRS